MSKGDTERPKDESSAEWGWRDSLGLDWYLLRKNLAWYLNQGPGNVVTIPMLAFVVWLCFCAALQTLLLVPVVINSAFMDISLTDLFLVPFFGLMIWFWPVLSFNLIKTLPRLLEENKDFWIRLITLAVSVGILVVCFRFHQGACMHVSNTVGPTRWNQFARFVTFVEYQEELGDSDWYGSESGS